MYPQRGCDSYIESTTEKNASEFASQMGLLKFSQVLGREGDSSVTWDDAHAECVSYAESLEDAAEVKVCL